MSRNRSCFICGRKGDRGFEHVEESVVQHPKYGPITVGNWFECKNKNACQKRVSAQHRAAPKGWDYEYGR